MADAVDVSFQHGVMGQVKETPILDLLEHYGVRVERNLVLDPSCGQVQIPQNFGPFSMHVNVPYPYFVRVRGDGFNETNPAVSSLADVVLPWVSSLTIPTEDDPESDIKATALASSSKESWIAEGFFNLNPQQDWVPPDEDKTSPHILAAHLSGSFNSYFDGEITTTSTETQISDDDKLSQINLSAASASDVSYPFVSSNENANLVVIGDADFVSAENASKNNLTLMLNLVDWLTLDNNLIDIRSRAIRDNSITSDLIGEGSFAPNLIRITNIVLMPAIMIIIGLFIFYKRRERIAVPVTVKTSDVKKEDQA
ncbi:Gldg family protein [Cellulosispirillum alkaliphilum]|uniref:Gldg family protein n=1 Tax=Cellulosispirillum alkaliphilum TaxID=3039283 RepID=UPI003D6FD9D5